ncbi:MAG: hypothetical protein EOO47_19975 [Flavobacterium sp.]|nr:MAG: hypothetical protein EOO47_19975 [Flavobacterium sp.]
MADLLATFQHLEVSFDLEDTDHILRLVFENPNPNLVAKVLSIIQVNGCKAVLLSDDLDYRSSIFSSIATDCKLSINAVLSIY